MTRILFVCLGNICRSPLAEAIFKYRILEMGITADFEADSCGTADYHIGMPPDPRTLRNAKRNGITIDHLGRQFHTEDFKKFDLILPMDASNRSHLFRFPESESLKHKIKLMRSFDSLDTGADVPDPYHGGESEFQEVFEILDRSVTGLVQSLVKNK